MLLLTIKWNAYRRDGGKKMGYLEEYEWILLNEIAYNISFIYKFEDMKNEILIWL